MDRRDMMAMSVSAGVGLLIGRASSVIAAEEGKSVAKTVTIVQYSDAGVRGDVVTVAKVVKPEGEWRRQLSAIPFEVTRRDGTERPGTGATLNNHEKGVYRCACCDTALFSSTAKFESGTGWPSFWQPLDKRNVVEHVDTSLNMIRTTVSCRRCDAHLGHVFEDGPKPTGLRYCMNSAAMRFAKA